MSKQTNTLLTPPTAQARGTIPAVPTIVGVPTPSYASRESPPLSATVPVSDTRKPTEPRSNGEFLQPGEQVGRYTIIRLIGRGGMGAVYEAHDTRLDRKVALKTLVGSLVGRPEAAKRFAIEAQAAARLAHPNVVAIHDCDTDGPIPYMAMELLQGEPMSARIRRGPLTPEQVADAMLGVCAGVQAAHDADIVHRDLKPSNIFLSTDWNGQTRARVLDFGISKIKDISSGGLTETGDIVGTSQYLSPEQAAGDLNVDGRSDQYSLGVVMYEAVTQRTPHQGEPMYSLIRHVVEGNWQPPRVHSPLLDQAFEAIILRAMRLNPDERYPSVFELGRALFPFASAKVQRLCSDYFQGSYTPESPKRAPTPARIALSEPPPPTAVLPDRSVPDWQREATRTSLPIPPDQAAPGGLPKAMLVIPNSDSPSAAQFVARQSSRRLIVLMGIGAVAILLSLTLVLLLVKKPTVLRRAAPTTSIAPPVKAQVPPASPLPPPVATPTPPRPEKAAAIPEPTPPHVTPPTVVAPHVTKAKKVGISGKTSPKSKGRSRPRFTPRGIPIL